MEIKSFKKGKKNTYILSFQEGKEITLFDDIIVKYELIPKKKLTEEQLNQIKIENDKLESYYKALQYLTIKLRTKKEVKKYLEKFNYSKESIEETLKKLEKEGYLKEEEYIKAFLNDSFRFSNDGPLKLKKKLIELGLDENKINAGLEEMEEKEWLVKLENLYQKKSKSKHTDGLQKWKQKCEQYFYNLGYRKEWIETIANKMNWQKDNTIIEREYDKLYRKCSRKYTGNELTFQIKRKLYDKGFQKEDIDEIIETNKKQ